MEELIKLYPDFYIEGIYINGSKENKIERLKDKIRETDYIAIKHSEGIDCSSYGNWKADRQALRDEINLLENIPI